MSSSPHIIDVGDNDFQYEVLAFSNQTPVVVDFWATWCAPCKILSPILEKLADEAEGAFRLAKVDVDANPNLTMQYQVQTVPVVKAFRSGQIAAEFTGALPESQIRDFLRTLAPTPGDLALEKGNSLLTGGEWSGAAQAFGLVLNAKPDDASALIGLAISHLAQGHADKALPILREFPASKQYSLAEQLIPLAEALAAPSESSSDKNDDLFPAYQHALHLITLGNIPAAIDGMLEILRADKNYLDGAARKIILGMLQLLGEESSQSRAYRTELSSLLF